jgi:serine/threonine protein kinase
LEYDFTFEEHLGSGTQASIDLYHAKDGCNTKFAVKSYDISSQDKDVLSRIRDEITFLWELNYCENIIYLDRTYISKDKIHLLLKFAKKGSLKDYIIDSPML